MSHRLQKLEDPSPRLSSSTGRGVGSFHPVIIAPTYNNARTLPAILHALRSTALSIIVVNDGCTDDSATILQAWTGSSDNRVQRIVLTHPHNRGKATALHTGFAHARELNFT